MTDELDNARVTTPLYLKLIHDGQGYGGGCWQLFHRHDSVYNTLISTGRIRSRYDFISMPLWAGKHAKVAKP